MYYHITTKDFGDVTILKPAVPLTQDREEGNVPRICVSETLLGCLGSKAAARSVKVSHVLRMSAVMLEFESDAEFIARVPELMGMAVYGCNAKAYLPPAFYDYRRHGEYWYVTKQKFRRIGFIDMKQLLLGHVTLTAANSVQSTVLVDSKYARRRLVTELVA